MARTFKAIFAAVILLLGFAAPLYAGPVEDAAAAYRRGDYETALRLFRQLADQGRANAQYNLGVMYAKGRGVLQNDVEALNSSALQQTKATPPPSTILEPSMPEVRACRTTMLRRRNGMRRLQTKGSAAAQFNLGAMQSKGEGVPKDLVHGYMWFDLAAARGDERSDKASRHRCASNDSRADRRGAEARARVEAEEISCGVLENSEMVCR